MPLLPKSADTRAVEALESAAAEFRRFNNLIERYLDGTGVPTATPPADASKASTGGVIAEVRDEWEIAVDEEKTRRREAEERAIEVPR